VELENQLSEVAILGTIKTLLHMTLLTLTKHIKTILAQVWSVAHVVFIQNNCLFESR